MTIPSEALDALRTVVGRRWVLSGRADLQSYASDGLPTHHWIPGAVVLPGTRDEVVNAVKLLSRYEIPFVARGAGTGLSGGALAAEDAVMLVLTRLNRGVTLGLPPQQITLLTVVEACQGLLIGNYCQDLGPGADHIVCAFHQAMLDVHRATVQALEKWTLAQLIDRPGPLDPEFREVCKMAKVLLPADDSG